MKLLFAVVVVAAVQWCICEATDLAMEAVVQECLSKEEISAEHLNSLWDGAYDDGASNEIMRFTKCLLELFGVVEAGVLKEDFIEKCSEHQESEKCADIYKNCNVEGGDAELENGFKIFVCLRKEFM